MAIITESWMYDVVCITTALIAVVTAFYKWSFNYWKQRNIETLPPSILFGNGKDIILQRKSFSQAIKDAYFYFKNKGVKHFGYYFFGRPIYVVADLELTKHIMQKDFQHFVNHGVYFNEKDDPLSAHLFALEDTKWKNLRAKLTPTFTSGRLKAMFQTLVDCSEQLKVVMDEMEKSGEPVDIKEIMGRFTTDIIGSCAFGIDCNSLKDPNAEFREYGRKTFEVDLKESLKVMIQFAIPRNILRKIGFKSTKPEVTNFFTNAVKKTVDYRETNNIYRKDFMHLLLQLKNRGKISDDGKIFGEKADKDKEVSLTFNEIAAQAFVFFLAGFETSSTTLTFATYELATHQDIQDKLRKEINDVLAKHDNKVTYDALMEMEYMDQIINETLRKYPPVGILNRECNTPYRIPGTDVTLEKGTQVFIPVMGIHHDPEFYPEPQLFKPERFNEENKSKRPAFTFLPFGEGPRICIGLRFGVMQTKVGLTSLLRNYRITLDSKTKTPLELEPQSLVTTADGGVWLNIKHL